MKNIIMTQKFKTAVLT